MSCVNVPGRYAWHPVVFGNAICEWKSTRYVRLCSAIASSDERDGTTQQLC